MSIDMSIEPAELGIRPRMNTELGEQNFGRVTSELTCRSTYGPENDGPCERRERTSDTSPSCSSLLKKRRGHSAWAARLSTGSSGPGRSPAYGSAAAGG